MATDAQRKATAKYDAEKIDSVRFRVPKGKKALIQETAKANGETINGMLNRLVDKEIERVAKTTITKIVEGLAAKGIQTVYGENICYDAAAMREASEAGHVVLVEITDVSIYQEIEKELRMLKDWNVDVAGCVGVE